MATIDGTEDPNELTGTSDADTINGLGGDDEIDALDGDDIVSGGDDNDTVFGGQGGDNISGDDGDDVLNGDGGPSYTGPGGDDTLNGGAGDDYLRGGAGVDTYIGGADFDRISFYLRGATQGVVANLSTNTIANDGYGNSETMSGIEGLGAGTAFQDIFTGDNNANYLAGGIGDELYGLDGADEFTLDGAADVDGGDGIDTLWSFSQQQFGALVIDGDDADTLADIVFATRGVEVYLWDNAIADDGFGNFSTITGIENIGGSFFADYIEADAENNTLWGYEGNDELYALEGNDTVEGGDGNDVLFGDGWNDWQGASGNDTLDGGDGNDFLRGGDGVDVYIGGDGIDRISFFMLAATEGVVANLQTGVIANDGYGNAELIPNDIEGLGAGTMFADSFTGNSGVNVLSVGRGDTALGLGGADEFILQGAPDLADGGDGVDSIVFIDGSELEDANNDGFAEAIFTTNGAVVNVATGVFVDGFGNAGSLANIENVTASNFDDVITGNGGVNRLVGGLGNDTINGGLGADIMEGGAGADTFYVNTSGDQTIEALNAGVDHVISSVTRALGANLENLTLSGAASINGTGNVLANLITGNTGANTLSGGGGGDKLAGGAGRDELTGGAGSDVFLLNVAGNAANRDTITDFNVAADTIHLDRSFYAAAGSLGVLKAAAFYKGAAAHDANDRIIYDPGTGALFYDTNGNKNGGSVQIATLDRGLGLTAADFVLVA